MTKGSFEQGCRLMCNNRATVSWDWQVPSFSPVSLLPLCVHVESRLILILFSSRFVSVCLVESFPSYSGSRYLNKYSLGILAFGKIRHYLSVSGWLSNPCSSPQLSPWGRGEDPRLCTCSIDLNSIAKDSVFLSLAHKGCFSFNLLPSLEYIWASVFKVLSLLTWRRWT